MRIRLGAYSLKIKSFSSQELGLPESNDHLSFEIYQKVFHLWYIPVFPVEKHWKIKNKNTGKEFLETTPEIRSAINMQLLKKRSPIWSYAGSILIALPVLFVVAFFLYEAIDETVDSIDKKIAKNNRVTLKEKLAEAPEIGDEYTFKTLNVDMVTDMNGHFVQYKPSHFSSPHKVDYMVNYITKDSVGFEYVAKQQFSDYSFGLKKEFRLSKEAILAAIKGYQDLDVLEYPNEIDAKTKDVVGIFEIKKPEETMANN